MSFERKQWIKQKVSEEHRRTLWTACRLGAGLLLLGAVFLVGRSVGYMSEMAEHGAKAALHLQTKQDTETIAGTLAKSGKTAVQSTAVARLESGVLKETQNWGLGFGAGGTKPVGNATAEELAEYQAYYVGPGEEKVIYLTFDCGYENGNTEAILDALKKHGVSATFFVVGHYLETAPELVKRMVEEGHTVGNHTYHHPDMSAISSIDRFREETDSVKTLFEEITGQKMSPYFRPPQGKYNADNLKMAKELGYHTFFWSLAYVDWNTDEQPTKEEALEKLCSRIHPGAIVLLHNTSATNAAVLDELLTKWEEMGYSFATLEDICGVK